MFRVIITIIIPPWPHWHNNYTRFNIVININDTIINKRM